MYDEPVYDEPAYEEPSYSGTGNHVGSVVDVAWNYVGNVYYLWGGTSPDTGFDCSGLAQYCYSMCGYYIGRTTYDQIAQIQSLGNCAPTCRSSTPATSCSRTPATWASIAAAA